MTAPFLVSPVVMAVGLRVRCGNLFLFVWAAGFDGGSEASAPAREHRKKGVVSRKPVRQTEGHPMCGDVMIQQTDRA